MTVVLIAVGSGISFSPGGIDVEVAGATLTVTGRALAVTDVITLEAGTSCPGAGGSIVLASGASVGGAAGARTLTASTPAVTTLVAAGYVLRDAGTLSSLPAVVRVR